MTHQLKSRDIIALGFMTFALFVGARNINRTKLIGASKGYLRWAKMHQLREQHQPGQFTVPLCAKH
ncbi:hypothetical protein MJL39_17380, partial [Salmonella enterica subsp. enterica serovar Montevideo]|nr:hypothetical protein [Salmonella enterica subsp. enterica serovar Montevideo]